MLAASGENAVVHAHAFGVAVAIAVGRAVGEAVLLNSDPQLAAVGQFHAVAQAALAAISIEHPRNGAGVLAQFGGFAFEPVNFLDDFDGNQDVVVLQN